MTNILKSRVRGELLLPGDHSYESSRKLHNGMIDKRPAAILRCAGVADIIAAVNFARQHDLLISVRAGGHGVAGFAVCDGGLMIDLSSMKSIRVEARAQTARAEGGVTWGEFDYETQAFGQATTGGLVRSTGVAGLTLGGGHGILMRKHGLACDNLISADVVTAEGHLLTASATENEYLFWGLRGGGGNFGIVTSLEFRLHPVGMVLGGLVIYPIAEAKAVLRGYDEYASTAPDEVGSLAILATLPDGAKAVVLLICYNGPIEEGERILHPLRTLGTPLADQVTPMPYVTLQSIVENFNPPGIRNYWKSRFVKNLTSDAFDLMLEQFATVTSPLSHVVLYTMGGAVNRADKDDTAVCFRDARHAFLVVGMWHDSAQDDRNIAWVRTLWQDMQPFSSDGFYLNYETDTAPKQVRLGYSQQTYAKLVALKQKYDPQNRFRLNQNIERGQTD